MVEAVRQGDYFDALQWLNTLASVELRFSASADEILAAWGDPHGQRLPHPAARKNGEII